MIKSLIKGIKFIDHISGTVNDAKTVKEGKGAQMLGTKILKKKTSKKLAKMFK